ncbi:MAG: thioredoxin family protein [Mycobacteriales bacterium]
MTISSIATKSGFNRVLESEAYVVAYFTADWCRACKPMGDLLNELAAEFGGRLSIVEINVGNTPELASRFGVRLLPTLLLFRSGAQRKRLRGTRSKAKLLQEFELLLTDAL